ncbi:MAG TPA: WD40 repeat domain-containing protein [Gemmataceae bacterium]|nr:WD40 repeat domain-containing protein [Gemmataceae bacterium]
MSAAPDRRDFLAAAGQLVFGAVTAATSPPPPISKPGDPLRVIEGDGLVPLPTGAVRRLGTERMRIAGDLKAVQFSPKGNVLIGAGREELRAWDPRTGKVLFRFKYPEGASVDAGRLTSRDTIAVLVRSHSGNKCEVRSYAFGTGKSAGHSPPLDLDYSQHTAFSTDGSLLFVVRQEAACLYDGATGKEKWRDALPAEAVGGCRFFPDGSAVALAAKGEVKVYGVATGKVIASLKAAADVATARPAVPGGRGRDWIQDLVVSADGRWVAAGVGEDEDTVCCWDVKTETVRHRLKPAAKPLDFTRDSSELITFKEGVVTIWSMATGNAVRSFDVPADGDLALAPDGTIVASLAGDAAILIDAATGNHLPHSADPPGTPERTWFAPDGRLLGLLAGWGGWVEWDLPGGGQRLIRPPGVGGWTPAGLSADLRAALYHRKTDYQVRDVVTGKELVSATGPEAANAADAVAALTPDGRALVLAAEEGLTVVAGKDRRVLRRVGEATGAVSGVTLSADGRVAAVKYREGNNRHPIEVYDLAGGRFLRRLATDGDVSALAFSPDGTWLAASHDADSRGRFENNASATVWDVATGKPILKVPTDEHREHVIAVSHSGRLLARLEGSNKIAVWEIWAGKVRLRLDAGGSVSSLAFAADGRTLAASVAGGPVFVWDLFAGQKERLHHTPEYLELHWDALRSETAERAFDTIMALVRMAPKSIPFLREKIAPVAPPDPAQVNRLIGDLDHKEYRRREAAMRALAELGERVRDPLQKAVAGGASPELRERIERLMADDDRPTLDQLRRLRAIEVVEVAGTPEAARLLAYWAGGASGANFTKDAQTALTRLSARTRR